MPAFVSHRLHQPCVTAWKAIGDFKTLKIMITFGFNGKFGGWLRSACAIVLGIIMVSKPETSLLLVVKIFAAFLIASGVVSIISGLAGKDRNTLWLMIVNSVVDIALGAILFSFPAAVASVMIIVLGVALLGLGIFQIVVLGSAFALLGMRFLSFFLPALCIFGGALLLFNPFASAATLTIVAGICVLVYGVSELMATVQMNRVQKVYKSRNVQADDVMTDVKDAEYEKID